MRNLKRALSLALASVMLLGMMVVGTGASYKDVDSQDHVEAIEVLQAAGVMTGDEKGDFNPDKVVTRAEMCVIICKMLYGNDLNVARFADSNTFTDVPAWAQGYVNLCASLGIVSGVGDGKFNPDGTVTTAEAALMLVRALEIEIDLNSGNSWSIAAMAAAEEADLFEDMDVLTADSGLTRNNVAQMVLNALKYTGEDTVYGVNLNDEDETIVEFDNVKDALLYAALLEDATYEGEIEKVDGSLIDEVFEIDVANGTDPYGRPATVYSHADWDQELTYADKADYTFVIDEDTTMGDLISDKKLTKKITTGYDDDDTLFAGSVIELFVDTDNKALESAVNYAYILVEITDVDECDEDDDEDAIADGASVILTIADTYDGETVNEEMYDIQVANYDAKTYVEGAMIVVPLVIADDSFFPTYDKDFENLDTQWVVVDTAIPASVDGKVTATSDAFFRIDGSKYINSTSSTYTYALSDEGTFYLDPNNFVIGYTESDDSVSLDDVAYVNAVYNKESTNDYGTKTITYYAQLVKLDGTVVNVVLGINEITDDEDETLEYGVSTVAEGLYTYKTYTSKHVEGEVNYKGCSLLTAWPAADEEDYTILTIDNGTKIEDDATKVDAKIDSDTYKARLNSKTTYILVEDNLADIEVTVKTGGVNTTTHGGALVIATETTSNYVASYVILPGSEAGAASYDDVIYVDAEADVEAIVVEDTDCVTFDVYTEAGKKMTVIIEGDDIADAGFYTYTIDDDGIYELTEVDDVLAANDGTGVKSANFVSYYGTLLTVDGLEDIETEGAVIIDLHDTDDYSKSVKTLAAMKTASEKGENGYDVALSIYADDGAVMIVVTSVTEAAE